VLPWCTSLLTFYDLHYPKYPNGTLFLQHAQSCETWSVTRQRLFLFLVVFGCWLGKASCKVIFTSLIPNGTPSAGQVLI
jgi:hypothetical protein